MREMLDAREWTQTLLQHSFDQLYLVDPAGRCCTEYVSGGLVPALTWDYDEWLLSLGRALPRAEAADFFSRMDLAAIQSALCGGKGDYDVRFLRQEPEGPRECELRFFYADGERTTLAALCRGRERAAEVFGELTHTRERFLFLVDHVVENFIEVRAATGECCVYRRELKTARVTSFQEQVERWASAIIAPEDRVAYLREFELTHLLEVLRAQRGRYGFTCAAMLDGQRRTLSVECALHQEETGEEYIFAYAQDVTQLKEQEQRNKQLVDISQQLLTLSQADPLTELYNRAAGEKFIEECLASASHGMGAMLLMDIDRFKDVNDQFGHQEGDRVLKLLSRCMQEVFRSDDILCRWGGDEFVVFLRDIGRKAAIESRIQRLRSRLLLLGAGEQAPAFTISIGGAVAGEGAALKTLFAQCDRALYQVKKTGRDGFWIDGG